MKQKNIPLMTRKSLKKRGVLGTLLAGFRLLIEYSNYKILKSSRKFEFNGKKISYFYYPYNATWRNERSIEIPIAFNFIKNYDSKNILELGNVLSHYVSVEHDILDKYEKAHGVTNEDVVDFKTSKKYDLIISISTIEHIGWDEEIKDPLKVLKALENLKKHLNKGGKIIATFSIGYNLNIDKLLKQNKLFDETFYMKRISKDNQWKQTVNEDLDKIKFGSPFPFGNVVVIGIINK